MGRFIEILKEFQNNSQSLSLTYLTAKFSLTIRTLQRDIQRINTLLSEISNCKIIKSKDRLILIGDNSDFAINNLLKKFLKLSNNNEIKTYQLLLFFIWENQPLSNSKLISFTSGNLYSLKQQLDLINSFFQYYQLNLSLKFKTKKGWLLAGSEQDLRLLATNILINLSHNASNPSNYLESNLFHLINKLKEVLVNSSIYKFYYSEILYFLIMVVRRIKIDKLLNNYDCHQLLTQLVNCEKTIKKHCDELINLLQRNFALKFNQHEMDYLKSVMFFNQKHFNNSLFSKLMLELKNLIKDLIFKKYQLTLLVKNFKLTLNNFLTENYLRFLFNLYQSFNFNEVKKSPFSNDDSYFYGWEILNIINFAFKQFNININFNLFVNDYWLMNFNSLYLRNSQKNWIIPLYYQENLASYSELNKVLLFIKNKYPNIILKSLDINNNVYQWNILNKQYMILLDDTPSLKLSQFEQILPIKYHHLTLNQLQTSIDLMIEKIMFNKISSSILVLDFFLKQKFYSLKTFLTLFQALLIRKFKINWIDFDLKDAFIDQKFSEANILLVHKLIPINNIDLPIILIYLKNPLFFHKRNPIHFIFILINNSNNLYQYDWMSSYLNLIKNNFNIKITSIKKLIQVCSNSLSHKSLVRN
ncbi:hypothetical protein [Spiroplasma platyhelix]|uniref:Uncharacterized protein n=1 Tax=Spiroplasma platyhelix PALS-1 TaxID=1276218 RepID=A0A846U9P8_9MOLU|nr:hypothetical protein [Spiroplasma platyhelix]MBE4704220.1 hypothetical protein [Spiroplasma platyhelix PALS-1]NKE38593.1 hypothetical protein [Spiroplasma platyhelix PALS-1]UJB28804.1 hypothetical protein SPLAT_v1c00370 [Spiroplasma platyhelix PALS-1]